MGEIYLPDQMTLSVAAHPEGGGQGLIPMRMYNRRAGSLHANKLAEGVIEILTDNVCFASGKLLGERVVCSLGSRGLELVSSTPSGLQKRTLPLEIRKTCGASASFCTGEEVELSDATESSEIGESSVANVQPALEVDCHSCKRRISSGHMICCSRKDCSWSYHRSCTKKLRGCSWRKNGKFICPQHVCHACGGSRAGKLWKCEKCPIASHEVCSPWPVDNIYSKSNPGWAVCWRHSVEETLPAKHFARRIKQKQRTSDTKEIFERLPVFDVIEDFTVSLEFLKSVYGDDNQPPPYTHIRRNVFMIKKKRDDSDDGVSCLCGREDSDCGDECDCRVQSVSCSKDCVCKTICANKPYRKDKRLKVVKTNLCGWGAKAAEIIRRGEFIIEYIGEVIDDAMCEKRLWAMKGRGINNFYMCEITKDFIIDATFKGNPSRYLNHSCQPNCKLEKWRVDGETRAGVFALRDISVGEPLTYNYKYVEFGPNVKCCCGSTNCRGAIGEKPHGTGMEGILKWGKKGRRSWSQPSRRTWST